MVKNLNFVFVLSEPSGVFGVFSYELLAWDLGLALGWKSGRESGKQTSCSRDIIQDVQTRGGTPCRGHVRAGSEPGSHFSLIPPLPGAHLEFVRNCQVFHVRWRR